MESDIKKVDEVYQQMRISHNAETERMAKEEIVGDAGVPPYLHILIYLQDEGYLNTNGQLLNDK